MSKNDDHIGQEAEDLSRIVDPTRSMYEPGSHIRCYKLLSVLSAEDTATANGVEANQTFYVNTQGVQTP